MVVLPRALPSPWSRGGIRFTELGDSIVRTNCLLGPAVARVGSQSVGTVPWMMDAHNESQLSS